MLPEINLNKPQGQYETKYGTIYYRVNSGSNFYCQTTPWSDKPYHSPDPAYVRVGQINVYCTCHFVKKSGLWEAEYPYVRRDRGVEDVPKKTADKLLHEMLDSFFDVERGEEFRLAEALSIYEEAETAIKHAEEKELEYVEAKHKAEAAEARWNNTYLALSM